MISSLKWKGVLVKFIITYELRKKVTFPGSASQWFSANEGKIL